MSATEQALTALPADIILYLNNFANAPAFMLNLCLVCRRFQNIISPKLSDPHFVSRFARQQISVRGSFSKLQFRIQDVLPSGTPHGKEATHHFNISYAMVFPEKFDVWHALESNSGLYLKLIKMLTLRALQGSCYTHQEQFYEFGHLHGKSTEFADYSARVDLIPFVDDLVLHQKDICIKNEWKVNETFWKKGKLEGPSINYSEDGIPVQITNFTNGFREGSIQVFGGKTGALLQECHYHLDRKHGLEQTWSIDGQITDSVTHYNDEMHGERQNWDYAGTRISSRFFNRGVVEGEEQHWSRAGIRTRLLTYVRGKREGPEYKWHDTTALLIETYYYINGEPVTKAAWLASRGKL